MELEPIIEALASELAKVGNVNGSALAIEAHANGALAGVEDGNLVTYHLIGGGI
jgi:hypothetical protein